MPSLRQRVGVCALNDVRLKISCRERTREIVALNEIASGFFKQEVLRFRFHALRDDGNFQLLRDIEDKLDELKILLAVFDIADERPVHLEHVHRYGREHI